MLDLNRIHDLYELRQRGVKGAGRTTAALYTALYTLGSGTKLRAFYPLFHRPTTATLQHILQAPADHLSLTLSLIELRGSSLFRFGVTGPATKPNAQLLFLVARSPHELESTIYTAPGMLFSNERDFLVDDLGEWADAYLASLPYQIRAVLLGQPQLP